MESCHHVKHWCRPLDKRCRLELQGVDAVVLGQRELGVQVGLEERLGVELLGQSGIDGLLVLLALFSDDGGLEREEQQRSALDRELLSRSSDPKRLKRKAATLIHCKPLNWRRSGPTRAALSNRQQPEANWQLSL